MSTSRIVLLVIGVFMCTAALVVAGSYYVAKTSVGQMFLRDFLVAQTKASFAAGSSTVSTSTLSTNPGILPIPESYATQEYFNAFNNVLQDLFAINITNAHLGPLLDTLNRQTLSCSYVGFYENMDRAHQLSNKNQTLVAQLGIHLSALAMANVQTKDAITKAYTQTLLTSGANFTSSLQAYATAANGLLIGDIPTSEQVAGFQSKVNAATGASKHFADALKPLMEHIAEEVQAVTKAASSAPIKK